MDIPWIFCRQKGQVDLHALPLFHISPRFPNSSESYAVCTSLHMHMCTHLCALMFLCMHVCTHLCTYVHIYVHTLMFLRMQCVCGATASHKYCSSKAVNINPSICISRKYWQRARTQIPHKFAPGMLRNPLVKLGKSIHGGEEIQTLNV